MSQTPSGRDDSNPDPDPRPQSRITRFASFLQRNSVYLMSGAAILFAAGSILLVLDCSTNGIARFFAETDKDAVNWPNRMTVWGAGLSLLGIVLVAIALSPRMYFGQPFGSVANFNQALVVIGYALVIMAVLNFVALAGFASQGKLDGVLGVAATAPTDSPDSSTSAIPLTASNKYYTLRLILMPGFAVLGSMFFVAGALRRKRDMLEKANPTGTPDFDSAKLWAGLWYRLGEAVLFALVIFLLFRAEIIFSDQAFSETWLLVLALLLGMFVKPAELLINGLAVRLLNGVNGMLK